MTIKSLVKEYNAILYGSHKGSLLAILAVIGACIEELNDQGTLADVWMGPAWHAPPNSKLLVRETGWGHLVVEER